MQPPFARARYFYIALVVVVVVVVRVAVGLVVPHVDVHEVVLALHRAQVVGADLGAPEQLDRLDSGAAWEFRESTPNPGQSHRDHRDCNHVEVNAAG